MASLPASLVSTIGSIFGGLFGGGSAKQAAGVEQQGAQNAQNLIAGNQNQALGLEGNFLNTEEGNEAPYLSAGSGAVTTLSQLLQSGALTPGTFAPPTTAQLNDPSNPNYAGYQFALTQGENAIQNSAAARGGLLSGNTATALNQYATGDAAQYAQQQYNNAVQQYQLGTQAQAQTYNQFAGLAGLGQTAAQSEGSVGTALTGQEANTLNVGGAEQASEINTGAQAQAAGIVGNSNALTSGISGAANTLGGYLSLQSLINQQQQQQTNSGYGLPGGGATYGPPAPPGYAKGGRIPKGQVSIVGEHGPEILILDHDGTVLPHKYFNRYRRMAA